MIDRALDPAELPARLYHPTHINREDWLFEDAKRLAKRGVTVDLTAFPDDGHTLLAADAITAWRKEGLPMDRLTCSSDGAGCLPTFDADGNLLEMDIGNPDTLLIAIQTLIAREEPLEGLLRLHVRRRLLEVVLGEHAVNVRAEVLVAHRPVLHGGRVRVAQLAVLRLGEVETRERERAGNRKPNHAGSYDDTVHPFGHASGSSSATIPKR